MEYTIISVPDMNDSFSRVVLGGTSYQMRFTWNDTAGRWMWGLLPAGAFGVITELEAVGRRDFIEGNAQFVFIPAQDSKK